jgi:hypothetical protein
MVAVSTCVALAVNNYLLAVQHKHASSDVMCKWTHIDSPAAQRCAGCKEPCYNQPPNLLFTCCVSRQCILQPVHACRHLQLQVQARLVAPAGSTAAATHHLRRTTRCQHTCRQYRSRVSGVHMKIFSIQTVHLMHVAAPNMKAHASHAGSGRPRSACWQHRSRHTPPAHAPSSTYANSTKDGRRQGSTSRWSPRVYI